METDDSRQVYQVKIRASLEPYKHDLRSLLNDGDLFCKIFEFLVCELNDHHMWTDIPLALRIKLGERKGSKVGRDKGIDSVSKDLITAGQAKWHPNSSIIAKEISMFFMATQLHEFDKNILFTFEGAKITKEWDELTRKFPKFQLIKYSFPFVLDQLKRILSVPPILPIISPFSFRKCQLEALAAIKSTGLTKIEMACGTGKSQVMIELCKTGRNVIFIPTLVLLEQFHRLFPESERVGTGYIPSLDKQNYVCVYDSAVHLKDLIFDKVIIDEAHHARELGVKMETIFNIQTTQRILFSATLESPDYSFSLRQAIDEKILSDYDVTIPLLDEKDKLENLAQLLLENSHFSRVLAYCNNRITAKRFQDCCLRRNISCGYLDGEMSKSDREIELEKFRQGKLRVISSIRTIAEGMDMKEADTCLFVDVKHSDIAIVQCVGRVLRKSPDKLMAHIVLPADPDEFKIFLKALSDRDEQLKRELTSNLRGRVAGLGLEEETEDRSSFLEHILYEVYNSKGERIDDLIHQIRRIIQANNVLTKQHYDEERFKYALPPITKVDELLLEIKQTWFWLFYSDDKRKEYLNEKEFEEWMHDNHVSNDEDYERKRTKEIPPLQLIRLGIFNFDVLDGFYHQRTRRR